MFAFQLSSSFGFNPFFIDPYWYWLYNEFYPYLGSSRWQQLRGYRLLHDNHKCRRCCKHATEVHHIKYPKTLGTEPLCWLVSLCRKCHNHTHRFHINWQIAPIRKKVGKQLLASAGFKQENFGLYAWFWYRECTRWLGLLREEDTNTLLIRGFLSIDMLLKGS